MRLSSDIVGATAGPLEPAIDTRWLMAYAAALGETAPEYFDTTRPEGILAHPLFPVCYEWPLALDLRARTLADGIAERSVHATHDLALDRLPRAGDRLRSTAVVTAVEPRAPGAYVLTRFDTVDAAGARVSSTTYGSLYRGVSCDEAPARRGHHPGCSPPAELAGGSSSPPGAAAGEADDPPDWSARVPIAPTLAHVYTECARIWNPIHTDRAVARAAGLPDIILHGTATLALAVSQILKRLPAGSAASVARIACRFSAMVALPSSITVQGWMDDADGQRAIRFQVQNAEGHAAVTRGRVVLSGRP
jgi:acyl dehydratase